MELGNPVTRTALAAVFKERSTLLLVEALLNAVAGAVPEGINEAQVTATQAIFDAAIAKAVADQAIVNAAAAQSDVDALEPIEYVAAVLDPATPNARVLTGDTGLTVDVTTPNVIQLLLDVVVALGYTPADIAGDTFTGPVGLPGYTVGTLPVGVVGLTAYVTDALAPTYLTAAVGGGAIVTPVFYNGAAWVTY